MISLLVELALVSLAAAPLAREPSTGTARPAFSWQRVPIYAHLGKNDDDFTTDELAFLAEHFNFITIEKGQAVHRHGATEEGIYAAARELKKLNPRMTVLFYWNAFLDYPLYQAAQSVKPEWHLKTASGEPLLVRGTVAAYDLTVAEMRAWWSGVAAAAMEQAPLDGIFADALPQVLTPAKARSLGAEKHAALVAGLRAMLAQTQRELGPGKMILANGTRGDDFGELADWNVLDGIMIEHFGHFGSGGKEDIAADIAMIVAAARKGKIVVAKGWPGFSFLDKDMMARPHEELAKLAAERITFPLACFLVAAQPRCYFCYTWGYRHNDGALDWYPEFSRPLGPPQGDAQRDRWKFTRQFEHASVFVDLEQKTARIDWRSGQ